MFRSKTVFVVGAGASCELNFPSGAQLLHRIADSLDIFFDTSNYMQRGDRRLYHAFQQLAGQDTGVSLNDLQFAGWRVRDAAKLGLSIDNVIHQFADDDVVARVAKLAIARNILQAEENSSFLRLNAELRPPNIDLASIRNTWLGGLAQLLVQDLTRSQAERVFDNFAIISFNYDRSITRFLPFALSSQFGISTEESQEISRQLRIFHPYGSLGPLPWEESDGTEFGDADHAPLIEVSTRIRTFTEQVEESESLASMRQALSEARHVVFLGFGYHRQNMTLLSNGVTGSALRVFGTSQGLSASDREVVSGQATHFIDDKYQGVISPVLPALDCVHFIREYFRALTS